MNTLIKNVVLHHHETSILIHDQKIVKIAPEIDVSADKVIDGQHNIVIPGLIDTHVHFRDPGLEYKENIHTGSLAAAHGGFTTVCAMPNVKPVVDTPKKLQQMFQRNQERSVINTQQFGAISNDLTANHIDDIKQMAKLGAVGFTNDGHGVQNADTMYQAMKACQKINKPLVAHVEDDNFIHGGVMNAGKASTKLGLPGMSKLSETTQLARDLVMAEATGVHYHVAHISTKKSVELVRIAKAHGINVTAEVSPHHLFLDDEMITRDNPMMKMNPPLRTPEDRRALIGGLLDGTIDTVATDHAPHSKEEKSGSMMSASFGIVGLETSFSLMYTRFVKSGLVSLTTLLKWMSHQPAKLFQLEDPQIKVGHHANLSIMDVDHPFKINPEHFLSKGKNTPFAGYKVYGQTMVTICNGKIVYQNK
ncbi:dihydroorotase [Philodulcilactobacillus myokoensis]|uniref:Dihydroorotase n=1 Tax=Philodulcilactobacillus myokoensis TaxID=2929573 RepID=A0A9W6EUV1_9LACO|nr:dihydroorotase [Philodulcilactobacillus myokoensis]GLB47589.1 dihydroorotase [Philodulcilactobacillus myokoensis]